MQKFNKIASYILLFANILLAFILLFETKIIIPKGLIPMGRLHPLMLHLPIGFAVILVVFYLIRKEIAANFFEKFSEFLLNITAISAAIVALLGFFLSQEGDFEQNNLQIHKYSGIFLSLFCFAISLFFHKIQFYKNSSGAWAILAVIAFTGHFGAVLTHGENYILGSPDSAIKQTFTENNNMFDAAVYPILEAKCVSCHNDKKTKGQLNLSSISKILKGGKNGAFWKAGDTLNSHIIMRANLTIDDKKHMPPKGKPQLTTTEIAIISNWIAEGANIEKAIKDYELNSKAKALVINNMKLSSTPVIEKIYSFSPASNTTIAEVNTPFCSVFPVANNSPALEANFFVSNKFDSKSLENLTKIKDQLVILNLSKMPINDSHLKTISNFKHLEKLILNQTDITGASFSELSNNKELKSIAVSGTKITLPNLEKLLLNTNLNEIFVWNTSLNNEEINLLAKKYPKTHFKKGAILNVSEKLKLNPPTFVNEDFILKAGSKIELKHSLKNVAIHYSIDGLEPDSTTQLLYTKPLTASSSIQLKAIATKEGWLASKIVSRNFFKTTYLPDSVYLITKPEPKYGKEGAKALYDLKKGTADNTTMAWLGYRETHFEALFTFKNPKFRSITMSYLKNIGSFIMPPNQVELWAGNDTNNLKLIQKLIPKQGQKGDLTEILALDFQPLTINYGFIKIIARPVTKLPDWHPGKGQKGWVFVDEVLFN